MSELLNNRKFNKPINLEDGAVLGKEESLNTDFSKKTDAYSNKGGVQNVSNQTFEIKGLKGGGTFSKRKWYEITFYSTETNELVKKENMQLTIRFHLWMAGIGFWDSIQFTDICN